MQTRNQITLIVTGEPVAKGRAQASVVRRRDGSFVTGSNGRAVITHRTPAKTRSWENDARQLARIEMGTRKPFSGPMQVEVVAVFVPSRSWPAWKQQAALDGMVCHTGKPDADNLAKAAKDALNGVVWVDDAQVIDLRTRKVYGERAEVRIQVLEILAAPSQVTRKADLAA